MEINPTILNKLLNRSVCGHACNTFCIFPSSMLYYIKQAHSFSSRKGCHQAEEASMFDADKSTLRLVHKFHRFQISAFPLPLPETEMVTLSIIRDLNHEKGVDSTLISSIAQIQQVAVPTISRRLVKLEEKGLIRKYPVANDRRNTCVGITRQGEAAFQEAVKILSAFINKALSHIDSKELEQFFKTFDKIYEAFSQEYEALRKPE